MIYFLNEDYLFVSMPIALKVFKWGECVRHSESWDRGRPYSTMSTILSVSKAVEPLPYCFTLVELQVPSGFVRCMIHPNDGVALGGYGLFAK